MAPATSSQATLAYPPEVIAKLGPGSELDRLVHTLVFKQPVTGKRKVPSYSLKPELLVPAFGHLPLGMGRSQPGDNFYSDERPYWAGHTGFDAIFTANSLALAGCKALVFIAQVVDKQAQNKVDATE